MSGFINPESGELRSGNCPLLISSTSMLLFFVAVENEVDRSIARVLVTGHRQLFACTDRFVVKLKDGIRIAWLTVPSVESPVAVCSPPSMYK